MCSTVEVLCKTTAEESESESDELIRCPMMNPHRFSGSTTLCDYPFYRRLIPDDVHCSKSACRVREIDGMREKIIEYEDVKRGLISGRRTDWSVDTDKLAEKLLDEIKAMIDAHYSK